MLVPLFKSLARLSSLMPSSILVYVAEEQTILHEKCIPFSSLTLRSGKIANGSHTSALCNFFYTDLISISERVKAEVFILPHHLDLTLSPFGSKMHCRDKEYYNGQQGKEYQDMKRTE